jgi:hypothetical protein
VREERRRPAEREREEQRAVAGGGEENRPLIPRVIFANVAFPVTCERIANYRLLRGRAKFESGKLRSKCGKTVSFIMKLTFLSRPLLRYLISLLLKGWS